MADHDDWTADDDARLRAALASLRTDVEAAPLPDVRYTVSDGRPKVVSYWAAEAVDGAFEENEEVDRMVWLDPLDARELLTHPRDRTLVDAALLALRGAR